MGGRNTLKGGEMGWRRVGKERTTDRDGERHTENENKERERGRDKWRDSYRERGERREMRGVAVRGKCHRSLP